jgi:hypothetical protein
MWPHLKNLNDSALQTASLKDLAQIGKQRLTNSKLLSHSMSENFETVKNFPEQVVAGSDDCTGTVHKARFLRGFVGDHQDLWLQARQSWDPEGIPAISNYEVVSLGLGDYITQKVWAKVHKPNARDLSIRMLSPKSVEDDWRSSDRSDSPKEFNNLHDLKMATATLEAMIHKVTPWNLAFKTVHLFMLSIDFGESELSNSSNRIQFLESFIDEALRTNAQNWEERKRFLSYQDLCVKWSSSLTRKNIVMKSSGEKGKGKGSGAAKDPKKPPNWICKTFNEGKCAIKDSRHLSDWNPKLFVKHLCNKWVEAKGRHCCENHQAKDHK